MAEYIEREALIQQMADNFRQASVDGCDNQFYQVAEDTVLEAPAADVVEVVRCKDCKHNVANWNHDELDETDYTDIVCDYFMTDGLNPDDFCNYGERKVEPCGN